MTGVQTCALPISETEWTGNPWGWKSTDIAGNDSTIAPELTGIGGGQPNTDAIISFFGDNKPHKRISDYAAKLCEDLESGGYDDWFLPSKDELNKMYENLYSEGVGGFAPDRYWSSSEYSSFNAWYQYFYNGYQSKNVSKVHGNIRVRAIRAF